MNLKEIRLEKGMTQIDVAKAVGVALSSYLLWEKEVGKPSPENLIKLKKVLEIGDM